MECVSSNKGSFAWKSLLQARQVIDLGSGWRIGDGQSVRIQDDRWLPKIPAARLVSPSATLPPDAKVSELINEDTHAWRAALIGSEFLPHEATTILGIPLSSQNVPDKQVWFLTPNGDYSTRSAYHLLSNVERSKRPSCSNLEKSHRLWNGFWGLQIPHKVKHMLWRAAHNAIPSLYNLWRRKVVTAALCPSYKSGSEDTMHALWTCPSLLVVWSNDEMLTKLLRSKFNDFSDLLGMDFLMKDWIDPNLLAICFWLVWSKRNSDRLGEPSVALGRIRAKAATLLHDFRSAQLSQPVASTIVARAARRTPPLPSHLKINFDGATV